MDLSNMKINWVESVLWNEGETYHIATNTKFIISDIVDKNDIKPNMVIVRIYDKNYATIWEGYATKSGWFTAQDFSEWIEIKDCDKNEVNF